MRYTTHILYVIIVFTLFFRLEDQKRISDKYKMEANKTMVKLSACYSEQSMEIHNKTMCNTSLYELREWLRECKCECKGLKDD